MDDDPYDDAPTSVSARISQVAVAAVAAAAERSAAAAGDGGDGTYRARIYELLTDGTWKDLCTGYATMEQVRSHWRAGGGGRRRAQARAEECVCVCSSGDISRSHGWGGQLRLVSALPALCHMRLTAHTAPTC